LVNNKDFERLIEAMEEDGTEAHYKWTSNLSDVLWTFLEPKVLTDYKADGTDCEDAKGKFIDEWNEISWYRRGDLKKLLAAYDIYSLRIGALQRANERIDALIAINFAKLLGPFLNWVKRVKTFELAQWLQRRLERLIADLEAAESAVKKAEVKLVLNVAVTAITTALAPEATLTKLLIAGGGMAAHVVIDQSLGEGSVTGTVVFVAGDGGEFVELSKRGKEAIEKVKGGSKSIGVAAGVVTAFLDAHDVFEGRDRVEEVKKEIEEVKKRYEELVAGVLPMTMEFDAINRMIQSVPDVLKKALAAGDAAAKNYDAIKREIEAVIREQEGE
jgi:hypothetical protein